MSKWLVLLLVLAVAFWWWSGRRRLPKGTPTRPTAGPAATRDMVVCAHCGLHLPREDALPAGKADSAAVKPASWYCCAEHRAAGRGGPGREP